MISIQVPIEFAFVGENGGTPRARQVFFLGMRSLDVTFYVGDSHRGVATEFVLPRALAFRGG